MSVIHMYICNFSDDELRSHACPCEHAQTEINTAAFMSILYSNMSDYTEINTAAFISVIVHSDKDISD